MPAVVDLADLGYHAPDEERLHVGVHCSTRLFRRHLGDLEPGTDYLALASSIPPKNVASTWKLFRGSRSVRRQLLGSDGVLGFSMLAEPVGKHYATLSVGGTRPPSTRSRPPNPISG
jgi:hypothetical protein